MGAVTLGISLLALSWNVIFNSLFDRLKARLQLTSGGWTRVVHALLFEGGLIILAVPLIAALMKISLLEAFILDIGVLLFFLPYTYVYHWGYDVLRKKSYSPVYLAKLERGHKLQKCPHLGGGQVPRRVIGVQRETLVRPVGEQLHQAAGLDRRVQAEVEHLRHGMPVFTHAV